MRRLEGASEVPDDPSLCFDCRTGNTYRARLDCARLRVGAEGRLEPGDSLTQDRARAEILELLTQTPIELDYCWRCSGLTPSGMLREHHAEWEAET